MKKVINGVLVNTQTIQRYSFEYEEDNNGKTTFLPNMYALLNCDCIDIATRKFGKYALDIVCDDEGLFKEDNQISVITISNGKIVEQIVGNVFICKANEEGESISLTEEEIAVALSTIQPVIVDGKDTKVLVARV